MFEFLLKTCTFPHCSLVFSLLCLIFAVSLSFFALFSCFSLKRARKYTETAIFLEISAIKLDKLQEFTTNIENKDYFPELFIEKRANFPQLSQKTGVIVNKPVIIRENGKENADF